MYASFRDGERYQRILDTVDEDERPPILIQLYSDGLDRDAMGHSSLRNKVHFTYIKVLNTTDGKERSPLDYGLVQVMYDKTLKELEYPTAMAPITTLIAKLVENGIVWKGRKHAVRLANLAGDGLERSYMTGMAPNFSKITHFDPLSYLSTKTRLTCQTVDELSLEANNLRTQKSYEDDLSGVNTREQLEARYRHNLVVAKKKKSVAAQNKKIQKLKDNHKSLQSKYAYSRGLKYNSPWHDVNHFHVTQPGAVALCYSHDFFSGFMRTDLAKIFLKMTALKYVEWKKLQKNILLARNVLRGEDKTNWASVLGARETFHQLPGNHACNHSLIRNFNMFFISYNPNDQVLGNIFINIKYKLFYYFLNFITKVFILITLIICFFH
jgi:hypothetical protein